jgi:hypothetical protein
MGDAALGGAAIGGGKLLDKSMAKSSPLRVLLDRALPNFDRITSGDSLIGGGGGRQDAAILAGLSLSALKGTRTAAKKSLQASLDSKAGFRGGTGAGAALGGVGGGVSGWNAEGDPEDRWKRVLTRAAAGAGLGAAGGGQVGLYGTAGARGLRSGSQHFGQRMRGIDELAGMGVLPKYFDHPERMGNAAGALISAPPGSKMRALKGLKSELREVIEQGDKSKVSIMRPGGNAPGQSFMAMLPGLRKAKITELDAGPIMNPDVAHLALDPRVWKKMQEGAPELQKFFGTVAGDTTRFTGNPKTDPKARLLMNIVERASTYSDGRASGFTERRRTPSLLHDIINRKSMLPIDHPGKRDTIGGVAGFLSSLPASTVRRTGLTRDEIAKVMDRANDEGNINIKRVWDKKLKDADKPRFSVDLTRDLKGQVASNPQLTELISNPAARWRDKILSEDKNFSREGIKNWKSSFNREQQQSIADIQRRLQRGENVNATRETEKALNVSRDDLREMFAKPPKPTAVTPPVAQPESIRLLPDQPVNNPPSVKSKVAPVLKSDIDSIAAAPSVGFKKGDIWELIVDDLKQGRDPKAVMPAWDKIKDVLGITKEDLLRDAGVRNAQEWEQFKRLMARAAKEDSPGELAKAAGYRLSIKVRWAMMRLAKAS